MSTSIAHEIKRSSTYWYHDGNIVLLAENTQFRVHQSLLEKQFPIFADAFAFTKESENVEGCPIVKLAGDQAEDWEHILMTVYRPFSIYSSTMEYPVPVIVSILRLAIKYESDHLRDMAATCLRKNIPEDLYTVAGLLNTNPRIAPPFIDDIFEILNAALDFGIQSIVPTTCLLCIKFMGLEKILNGHTRNNGSTSSLSPTISKMLLRGWQSMLVSAIDLIINRPMENPTQERCEKQFAVDISPFDMEVYDCNEKFRMQAHALRTQRVAENPANAFFLGNIQLCKVCAQPINDELSLAQDELWDKLPSFFGFPAWDQLKDFEA